MGAVEGQMIDQTSHINYLHGIYCQLSKRSMTLNARDFYHWEWFISQGYKVEDLRLVIGFIQKRIKEGRRFPESLRIHNLLDPAKFADDICDARQESRNRLPSARSRILEASSRPQDTSKPARSTESVMRESQALRDLLALRDSL